MHTQSRKIQKMMSDKKARGNENDEEEQFKKDKRRS
jgi:hypothetical protein